MRNVHVVPSLETMRRWLQMAGYEDIVTVDVTPTTSDEQRSTDWMTFESLAQCLDAGDPARTVEGYPAPVRGALLAHGHDGKRRRRRADDRCDQRQHR